MIGDKYHVFEAIFREETWIKNVVPKFLVGQLILCFTTARVWIRKQDFKTFFDPKFKYKRTSNDS